MVGENGQAVTVVRGRAEWVVERPGASPVEPTLDAVFGALADPTRRAILSRLMGGQASVREIAAPFAMSQPAISRHLKVLERAGLVEREVDEQRRPARLAAANLATAADWLAEFRSFWPSSFDNLADVLQSMRAEHVPPSPDSPTADTPPDRHGRRRDHDDKDDKESFDE